MLDKPHRISETHVSTPLRPVLPGKILAETTRLGIQTPARNHTWLNTITKDSLIMAALAQARQAMAANYKALKEDFVSNLTGGEIKEINYVTAVAPVSRRKTASVLHHANL